MTLMELIEKAREQADEGGIAEAVLELLTIPVPCGWPELETYESPVTGIGMPRARLGDIMYDLTQDDLRGFAAAFLHKADELDGKK